MSDESAGERTEEPTPRRLQEARRRGDVALSRDLQGALVLGAATLALTLAAPAGVGRMIVYLRRALREATDPSRGAQAALWTAVETAAALTLLPLVLITVMGVAAGLFQTGGLITMDPLRLDPGRMVPRWGRVFGTEALAEVGKGIVKLAVAAIVAVWTLMPLVRSVAALAGAGAGRTLAVLGVIAGELAFRLALAAGVVGVGDWLWQRARYRRRLRMTREEVKREVKESEGEPQHRAERQRLHRELTEQRMLEDVRKADFVVVNPDHIAVAVRYERDGTRAPTIVAKGERLLAEKIKEVARQAGVPILREVTLARALNGLDEGQEIPESLYEAVAEILRVVYRMSQEPGGDPGRGPDGPAAAARSHWSRV